MMEFVGQPKMYSFTFEKKVIEEDKAIYYQEEKERTKGVSKTVMQSNIQHENYLPVQQKSQMETLVTFRSFHHQLHTVF